MPDTETKTEDQSAATSEAEMDTWLSQHDVTEPLSSPGSGESESSDDSASAPKAETKPRNEKEQLAAKTEPADKEKSTEESKDTGQPVAEAKSDEPSEVKATESVNPEDYRKAIAALQRDGLPAAALEALGPEKLVKYGLERALYQGNVDGYGAKVQEAEKKATEAEATTADATAAPVSTSLPDLNIDDAVEHLGSALKEMYGDEVEIGEPLKKFGQSLASQIAKRYDDPFKQQQELIVNLGLGLFNQEKHQALASLPEKYQHLLSDQSRRETVSLKMTELARSGMNFETMSDLAKYAVHGEFAEELLGQAESNQHLDHQRRDNGQSTTEGRTTPAGTEKTIAELEDDFLNADYGSDERLKIERVMKQRQGINLVELMDKTIA